MPDNNSTLRFWPVFVVLVGLAVLASVANLFDFIKMNKIQTEGKRQIFAIDSIYHTGSRDEIFVNFTVAGKVYRAHKKVKNAMAKGDSVAVYYLETEPSSNAIASE
jgi:hypothetical protein